MRESLHFSFLFHRRDRFKWVGNKNGFRSDENTDDQRESRQAQSQKLDKPQVLQTEVKQPQHSYRGPEASLHSSREQAST